MGRLTKSLAATMLFFVGAMNTAEPSDAQPQCFEIESIQAAAASNGQIVVFSGVANVGLALVVFMNESGEWLAADMDKEGVACLLAQGRLGRTPQGAIFIPLVPEDPA